MSKPLALDLCCGKGGWAKGLIAAGFRVIGFDIKEQPEYPGEFMLADVRVLAREVEERYVRHSGESWYTLAKQSALIVASPPCEEFSRHQMPWTKRRNPPPPDLSIVNACKRIAEVAAVPFVLENVRKAQDWLGRAKWHAGSFYLWGDVPALMPRVTHRNKETYSSSARLDRAMVPPQLAEWIGRIYHPETTHAND